MTTSLLYRNKEKYLGIGIIILGVFLSFLLIVVAVRKSQKTLLLSELYEAKYYHQVEGGLVQCELCPNRCLLKEGQRGLCKVRENIKGKLYSLVYGKSVTVAVDPIEKKPLYHFLPGANAYSLATAGCNLSCKYCQNWDISQRFPEDVQSTPMSPEEVVSEAIKTGSQVIAFTYNEPVVWFEYMLDIAKIAKQKKVRTVMISSGYINKEPLSELLSFLDAVKVDLKAFDDKVYREMTGGKLEPVLETIKTVHNSNKWLEIVYLVVPGYTDNLEKIKEMCLWIKGNVGNQVPVHFSRFGPKYKLSNLPPTSEEVVKQARQTCLEAGLNYVYTGNIQDETGSATYCPANNQPVIRRLGYFIKENLISLEGKAQNCPETIPGVWQ